MERLNGVQLTTLNFIITSRGAFGLMTFLLVLVLLLFDCEVFQCSHCRFWIALQCRIFHSPRQWTCSLNLVSSLFLCLKSDECSPPASLLPRSGTVCFFLIFETEISLIPKGLQDILKETFQDCLVVKWGHCRKKCADGGWWGQWLIIYKLIKKN